MRKKNCSTIINVNSVYGSLAPDWDLYKGTEINDPAAYSTSKAGLLQLTHYLATTLSPEIRVNCFSIRGIKRNQPSKFVNRYINKTPIGRMAREEDFKGIVAFFASDLSKYMTGQNLIIDGGRSI